MAYFIPAQQRELPLSSASVALASQELTWGSINLGYDYRIWALVGGTADACGYGSMDWHDVNGAWRATLPVAAKDFEEGELTMEMVVRPGPRVSEPSVLLMFAGGTVRRVDVNGTHREPGGAPRRETHIQGEPPPSHLEWLGTHPVFSAIAPDSTPDGSTLEQVFHTAASLMYVDVHGVDWVDPPEGRP